MSTLSADLIAFAKRIEALENERDAANTRADRAERQVDDHLDTIHELRLSLVEASQDTNRLSGWIVNHRTETKDHACVRCVPNGDVVVDGFICGQHRAEDIQASLRASEGVAA